MFGKGGPAVVEKEKILLLLFCATLYSSSIGIFKTHIICVCVILK